MLRPAFLLVLASALQVALAQQVESHGVPASVLSPTSPGIAHGVPSSITSPAPRISPNGRIVVNPRHFKVRFGDPRLRHGRREFIPVPIFIPAYPINGNYSYIESEPAPADESAQEEPVVASSSVDAEALREAYNRGARDALAQQADSRYGQHYLDAREKAQSKSRASKNQPPAKPAAKPPAPEAEEPVASEEPADNSPATVFIFKDGRKLQTQNYAIQGQTLFDFSNNQLKKIKLDDLDLEATKKANDQLGIILRFPPAP